MKYLVIFKSDLFTEGIQDHIIEADYMDTKDGFVQFYVYGPLKTTVAMYKTEHVVSAILMDCKAHERN